jgi:hypothetical protein
MKRRKKMKIRTGFVSNSSTTSFCIYGVELEKSSIREYLKKQLVREYDEADIDFLISKYSKNLEYNYGPESDYVYIGRSFTSIKDDETGAQFKQNIKDEIAKIFNTENLKFGIHSEAFFDG